MSAHSSRESSKGVVLLALAASLGSSCGGGGSKYPDPVGGTGGAGTTNTGGTGTTGTGGTPGTGGAVGTGGSTPGGAIARADYGTAVIQAECTFNARCGLVPDYAGCIATTWVGAATLTLQADTTSARADYDPAQAGACIDAIRNAPCTLTGLVAQEAQPSPCTAVFSGKVAAGATCYANGECAGKASCLLFAACTTACCAGTCVAPTTATGDCASAPCPTGSYCRQTATTTFRCTPQTTTEGAFCDHSEGCAAPLLCIADTSGLTGTCGRTLPATGGVCNQSAGCDDARDYCSASNVCARWVGVGAACTAGTATTVDNCVWYAYCTAGVCKQLGAPGAVCITDTTGELDDCLGGQTCPVATRTCTAPPAAMSCR